MNNEQKLMITKRSRFIWVVAATVVICLGRTGDVTAHHSYSVHYDADKPRTVTGVIQSVRYASPHVSMQLQTAGNPKQNWTIDLPSPSRAQQRGLTQNFLKVGLTATVVGLPARDGSNELGGVQVTIDEKTVQLR